MNCGLLGRKLSHSYSPRIHSYLGSYTYHLFEKEPEQLEDFLKNGAFSGLNVTIPYKKAVIPYCSELTAIAAKLGAVNTLVKRTDGTLLGHNSDYFGFQTMLNKCGVTVAEKKVLVLGSGGASATAVCVLEELGAKVIVISRSGENHYGSLHLHTDAAVIVNATPVGMYPDVGVSPVDLRHFPNLEAVLDIIYNPSRTQLLLDAEQLGLKTENGLYMLVAQAKESAELFSGHPIPNAKVDEIHGLLRREMENIVLIGMPGCGKSTVAKALGALEHKKVIDADDEIITAAGMSIPSIFSKFGEDGFRKVETQVLARLGTQSGLIIATGGGCVTRAQNYSHLHQNGTIIYLTRQLEKLPTSGRPLSQQADLSEMFQCRNPLYESFADYTISNDGTLEDTIAHIRRIL